MESSPAVPVAAEPATLVSLTTVRNAKFATVQLSEDEDDRGYYANLGFEPSNLDTLLEEYGGILKTRTSSRVVVFFKENDKRKGDAFLDAAKKEHEYYKPTSLPDGIVRCDRCRKNVPVATCYHLHDKGVKTYECMNGTACVKVSPPFSSLVPKEWPSCFPPENQLTKLSVPKNLSFGDSFYIHPATQTVFKYQACRCICLKKWHKLTDDDAKRLIDLLQHA